eukprot:2451645-Prymnesium_polylepis.2
MRDRRFASLWAGRAYYWWEVFALLQRTVLTGWLLLIHNDLRFLRLVAALLVSVAFLVAVLACNVCCTGFKTLAGPIRHQLNPFTGA